MAMNIPPEDMILEILLRLPVKSVLRFRSICKSWLRLISHPDFVSNHQAIASQNPENCRKYIVKGLEYLLKFNLNDYERTNFGVGSLCLPCMRMMTKAVGVCNGVVCLGLGDYVMLWNPATRRKLTAYCPEEVSFVLPHVEGTESWDCIGRHSYGFGMDVNMRDYVYLWIFCRRWDSVLHSVVRMYSTRCNSWRVLEGDFQFLMTEYKNCAIVKGVPYWTVIVRKKKDDDKLSEALVSFDVRREVFKLVDYPEAAFKRGNRAYFVEFNGHLAALVYCPGEQYSQLVDVWVLDDEVCWSKKFTVGPIFMEIERLVGCSGDGDILGLDTIYGLFSFLARNKETHSINDEIYGDIDVHNYYETLASVDGMKDVDQEE